VDVAPLAAVFERLAASCGVANTGVYLQVTRGAAPRRHRFPEPGTRPTVYGFADPTTFAAERWETGVAVVTVPDQRWARCDVKSLQLLPNVLANQHAYEAGVEECLFVRDGFVTEGSHTNVFAVHDGRLATHPDSPYVLPGVTRAVVIDLAARLNIPLDLRPIAYEALLAADEVFITSTSEEVLPVTSVDGRVIASGEPGPLSRALLAAFRAEAGVH
jgi:D-alanine transaminase